MANRSRFVGPPKPANDASYSNASYGPGPRVYRGFKSRGQRLSFSCMVSSRFKSNINKQDIGLLPTWKVRNVTNTGSAAAMTEYAGVGYGVTAQLLRYCQEELRRTVNNTIFQYGGQAVPGEPKGIRSAKFVIHHLWHKHEIKSTSQVPIHITFYELVLRPRGAGGMATGGSEDWVDPITAWERGLAQKRLPADLEDVNTPGGILPTVPFQKPFESHLFGRMFRVYKTTTLVLNPGQTHIHRVAIKPRNMFGLYPSPESNFGVALNDHMNGVETCTMYTLHGTPVHQKDALDVGIGSASFDCVTTSGCSYQLYDQAMKNYHQFNYLPAITLPRTTIEDTDAPTDLITEQ